MSRAGDAAADTGVAAAPVDPVALANRLRRNVAAAGLDSGSVRAVRAPGRVNLIGEHTDYNDGLALPFAIDRQVTLALVPTDDRRVEITLADGTRDGFDLDRIGPPARRWIDYVAGTAWAMQAQGLEVRGFRGLLASNLPQGAGLSSSAALELVAALALSGGIEPGVDRMTLARVGQLAENEYVGLRCGLMDQFASAFGEDGAALFLDCRSMDHRPVPVDLGDVALVVCHSGSPRRLGTSAYNERRAQCAAAVAAIRRVEPSVASLRDVTLPQIDASAAEMGPVVAMRARHVVTENARVVASVQALEAGDMAAVGELLREGHRSMRDQYEVTSPEIDALVEIADAVPGVLGSRLTGGGFGGSTITLVRREAVDRLAAVVGSDYPARTGLSPTLFEVWPSRGAEVVDVGA